MRKLQFFNFYFYFSGWKLVFFKALGRLIAQELKRSPSDSRSFINSATSERFLKRTPVVLIQALISRNVELYSETFFRFAASLFLRLFYNSESLLLFCVFVFEVLTSVGCWEDTAKEGFSCGGEGLSLFISEVVVASVLTSGPNLLWIFSSSDISLTGSHCSSLRKSIDRYIVFIGEDKSDL